MKQFSTIVAIVCLVLATAGFASYAVNRAKPSVQIITGYATFASDPVAVMLKFDSATGETRMLRLVDNVTNSIFAWVIVPDK
jgi:hypothetical protein